MSKKSRTKFVGDAVALLSYLLLATWLDWLYVGDVPPLVAGIAVVGALMIGLGDK